MVNDTREFVSCLGGYRAVALRLAKKPTTVHDAMRRGTFPASWYVALCLMAKEVGRADPPRAWFSFLELQPETGSGEGSGVAA